MDSGLPWAAVLGNHDQESTMTREELMSFISLMDYSVTQTNPPVDDLSSAAEGDVTKNIDGFGNYNLRVYGAPGSHLPKRNETGSSYGWFKEPHYFPCSFIPTWEVS
jgi:hypothetical protein